MSNDSPSAGTAAPGAAAQHSIITPECRENRGDQGAWDEAVARAKREYDAVVEGWKGHPTQPTIHLVLSVERPWKAAGQYAEVRDEGPTTDE